MNSVKSIDRIDKNQYSHGCHGYSQQLGQLPILSVPYNTDIKYSGFPNNCYDDDELEQQP